MQNLDHMLSSYEYELDKHFIASRPVAGRHNSKLLVYDVKSDTVTHRNFKDLASILDADSTIVMNHSKVFPCRLLGYKSSGGKVELFLLSLIPTDGLYPAMIRSNGKKNLGELFEFGDIQAQIVERGEDGSFLVKFNLTDELLLEALEKEAQIPIPPYIRGGIADEKDIEDYQTVYAQELGSVAAPTAGLHFTQEVFSDLEKKGIETAYVTLHVGAGTFKPVTTESLLEHKMHSEYFDIDNKNLKKINSNKKIFAVGTTSLRVLESTYTDSGFCLPSLEQKPYSTDIFLYPGVEVNSIAGLITNFHLPKSSLLMLVSAIVGRDKTLELYEIAKQNNYRFFSYGDAMLIIR